jgi:beta-lactam-binding protein with PASTA domain
MQGRGSWPLEGPERDVPQDSMDVTSVSDADASGVGDEIHAAISVGRDFSGQAAFGKDIVQIRIDKLCGNVVMRGPPGGAPTVNRRPPPVRLVPRPPAICADRSEEIGRVVDALVARNAIGIWGPEGVGRSTLLRAVAHQPQLNHPDGIVHLWVGGDGLGDLGQSLFDTFYTSSSPYKPSRGELRQRLIDVDAAVMLDDLDLPAPEVDGLIDWLPRSGVAFASRNQNYASSFALQPLSTPTKTFTRDAVGVLTRAEQRILSLLLTIPALLLDGRQLAAVAGLGRIDELMETLEARGLVHRNPGRVGEPDRFSSSPAAANLIDRETVVAAGRRVNDRFAAWAQEQQRSTVRVPANDVDAARTVMSSAARDGQWGLAASLARAVESTLCVTGRWEAWDETLSMLARTAQHLNDDDALSFALHQKGVLALVQGEFPIASDLLQQALRLREQRGDQAGAQVTRANLELLPPPVLPPTTPPQPPTPSPPAWMSIALGTLLVVTAAVAGLFALGVLPPSNGPTEPVVPRLVGLVVEQAEQGLQEVGLGVGEVIEVSGVSGPYEALALDEPFAAGTVVAQDPAPGFAAEVGATVALTVVDERSVVVPDVRDLDYDSAAGRLEARELGIEPVGEGSPCVDEREVIIDQTPAPGHVAPVGTALGVTICSEEEVQPPDRVPVPRLVGLVVEQAEQGLQEVGLGVGEVIEVSGVSGPYEALALDEPFAAGTVVAQDPAPGFAAEVGATVALTVVDERSVVVPDVRDLDYDSAAGRLEARELGIEPVGEGSPCVDEREVIIDQTPAPGHVAPVGTFVNIVLCDTDPSE